VSPQSTRRRIIELIEEQARLGEQGRIAIKVNGLTDPAIIDALYQASGAGVNIRLIVRTLCCLRPGVPGLSENIEVHSLVGQFLEHSRIFMFGHAETADSTVIIGSADMMERNLDRRVEVLVPVDAPELRGEISNIFETTWRDDTSTWILGTDRRWRRLQSVNHFAAQEDFKRQMMDRSRER